MLTDMESLISRLIIQAPTLLLAIVIHEAAHAYMAHKFGDDTAKLKGRLTLNPAPHIDVMGTIVFPLIGLISGWVMFGWAKPVPVDPRKFSNARKGIFWVSFAGPLSNIILALISAFLLSILFTQVSPEFSLFKPFTDILKQSVIINIVLAVFNLIPWPPLDGSKMVSSFMDYETLRKYEELSRYSLLFFIFLMFTGVLSYVITPAIMMGQGAINLFINILS